MNERKGVLEHPKHGYMTTGVYGKEPGAHPTWLSWGSRWDISLRSSSTLLEGLLSLNRYHDMNHDAAGVAASGLTLDYGSDLSSLLGAREGR